MKSKSINPLSAAIGASLLASTLSPLAAADSNPFALSELTAGYQLAQSEAATPAEGKGGEKKADTEGKCGDKKTDAEGKCGDMKAGAEGTCGDMKAGAEGKCGQNTPDGY